MWTGRNVRSDPLDHGGDRTHARKEVSREFVVACGNAPERLELGFLVVTDVFLGTRDRRCDAVLPE
jgi:hypothetical protein